MESNKWPKTHKLHWNSVVDLCAVMYHIRKRIVFCVVQIKFNQILTNTGSVSWWQLNCTIVRWDIFWKQLQLYTWLSSNIEIIRENKMSRQVMSRLRCSAYHLGERSFELHLKNDSERTSIITIIMFTIVIE